MSEENIESIKSLTYNNIYYKIISPLYNAADAVITSQAWFAISKPIYNEVHRSMPHIISSFFVEYAHNIRESS